MFFMFEVNSGLNDRQQLNSVHSYASDIIFCNRHLVL